MTKQELEKKYKQVGSRIYNACRTMRKVDDVRTAMDSLIAATHIQQVGYRKIAIAVAHGNLQYALDCL
jgi:phosphoribosylamine-glycine ligase